MTGRADALLHSTVQVDRAARIDPRRLPEDVERLMDAFSREQRFITNAHRRLREIRTGNSALEDVKMIEFKLNGNVVSANDAPDTPLLWVVRDTFKLKGSKYGCGAGLCGACTVLVDGVATRACVLPLGQAAGREVLTIEGLGTPGDLHPLQAAWIDHNVPQCGYCQSGQIMSAAALLAHNPSPTEADVDAAMAGNICRCGCYPRIKKAILAVGRVELADEVPPKREVEV